MEQNETLQDKIVKLKINFKTAFLSRNITEMNSLLTQMRVFHGNMLQTLLMNQLQLIKNTSKTDKDFYDISSYFWLCKQAEIAIEECAVSLQNVLQFQQISETIIDDSKNNPTIHSENITKQSQTGGGIDDNTIPNNHLYTEDVMEGGYTEEVDSEEDSIEQEGGASNDIDKLKLPSLILFYSSDCPHCINFLPEWEKLEQALSNINGKKINIVKNNCKEDPKTCSTFGINGVPTIKLFYDGMTEYEGTRTVNDLIKFIKEQTNIKIN